MFETGKTPGLEATFTSALTEIDKQRWQYCPTWLKAIREEGKRYFEDKGFPARKNEEWKYTDITTLTQHEFLPPKPSHLEKDAPAMPSWSELEAQISPLSPLRLVLVNGFYAPELSRFEQLPLHVAFQSLARALENKNPLVKKHLATYADYHQNPFVALSNAYIEDGAFIHIPRETTLSHPLHIVYITTDPRQKAYYPRNLIVADQETKATIIEEYIAISGNDSVYLNNTVSEIVVAKNAALQHYKLQQEGKNAYHIAYIQSEQDRDSHFSSHSYSFGGTLTRNNIHSFLFGKNASCNFNGLYIANQNQYVDNHTLIYHHSPHCNSTQRYHGILNDQARGVFNGKIYVEPEAQQTDSQQTSRALLLSEQARVDAKPQLEIFADDVKCTHGATVGRLDSDSLYYLRSRGIDHDHARKILTLAFAQQIVDGSSDDALKRLLKERIESKIKEHN